MSTTVDERIVSMEFDNEKMSENLKQTEKDLQQFEKSLKLEKATEGISNIESAVNNLNIEGLNSAIETINSRFSVSGELVSGILQSIAWKAVQVGETVVRSLTIKPAMDGLNEYQMQMDAIQTIATNTKSKGTTIDQINAALDDLNTYADKTIFNFSQMVQNIGTFTAAGVGLEDSVTSIKGFMNLAAGVGASNARAQGAAFQLSQGLAAGIIRAQDWMSIETAQMGGELFQNELLKTAKAFGVYEKAQAAIAKEGTFKASLKENWLSAEIVTETLARMADETTDIGKELTHAATDIRTVSALFDSMGEAMGSPWAQTWRIIIGDLEEAKELFNMLGHSFERVMNILNGGRNELLQNWKDLGGRAELLKAIGNILHFVEQVIYNVAQAFKAFFPSINGNDLYQLSVSFRQFTDSLVMNKEELKRFNKIITPFMIILGTVARAVLALAQFAFPLVADGLGKVGSAIVNILDPLATGFIYIWNWINGTKPLTKSLNLISNAFAALGTVWNNIKTLVVSFGNAFNNSFKKVTGIDISGTINGWVTSIKKFFASIFGNTDALNDPFDKANNSILGFIFNIANGLSSMDAFTTVTNLAASAAEGLGNVFNWIKESKFWTIFETIKNGVVYFVGVIKDKFTELFTMKKDDTTGEIVDDADKKTEVLAAVADKLAAVWDFFKMIGEGIASVFSQIWSFISENFSGLWDGMSEELKEIDVADLLGDIVTGGLFGGILSMLWKLFGSVNSIEEAVTNLLDSLGNAITNISRAKLIDSTAAGLKTVADSILKIVAAIIIISLLDEDKVTDALATLALIVGELAGALGLTGKAMDGFKDEAGKIDLAGTVAIANVISTFGTAIIKLAIAMAILNALDQDKLQTGFLVVSGLLGVLGLMTEMVGSKLGELKQLQGVALAIKTYAKAVMTLAIAVALLSLFDTDKMQWSAIILIAIMGVFGLIVSYVGKNIGMMKKLEGVALVISKFSNALIKIAIAIMLVANIPTDRLIIGAGVLVLALSAITVLAIELAKTKPKKLEAAGAAMLAISGALLMAAIAIATLGIAPSVKGMLTATALVKLLKKLTEIKGDAKTAAVALVITASALILITASLIPFAFLPVPQIFAGVLAMIFLIATFTAFSKAMNPATVIPVAQALMMFGVALIAMVTALMLVKDFNFADSWQGFAAIAVMMALFIVVMYAMQPLGGVIVAIAASILMFSAALLILAIAMQLMSVALPAFALALLAAAPMLVAALGVLILGLLDLFYMILVEVEKILPAIVEVIVSFLVLLADALIEPLLEFILKLLDLLAKYLPTIIKLLVDLVLGVIWGILSGLADWIGPIVDELFRLFVNLLKAVNKNLKRYKESISEELSTLFVEILDLAYKTLQKLFSKLAKWGSDIGTQIGKGLGGKKIQELKNKMIKPITDGWNWMKKKVDDFVNVGRDFIQGLIDGVGEKIKGVTDALAGLGEWALNTIKSIFGIESPSKEMHIIGNYLIDGLINGINDRGPGAVNSLSTVGKNMLTAAKSSMNTLREYLENESEVDMSIKPVANFSSFDADISRANRNFLSMPITPMYAHGDLYSKQTIEVLTSNADVVDSIRTLNADVNDLRSAMEGMAVMLDGRTLVGQIAAPLNKTFGNMIGARKRGKL